MYKNRGKPEDPWNQKAAEQVKALAGAIQITNIQKNGVITQLQTVPSSIIARQKELTKRRNNYEEFKQIYGNKLKRNINRDRTSHELESSISQNLKYQPINLTKQLVNTYLGKSNNKEVGKGTMLRAPLGAVKTINVEVPAKYKEQAIFSPPKSGEGETFSFSRKLQQIEMLNNVNHFSSDTDIWANSLVKELQCAHAEVDVGNVQLEQIGQLLQASKTITGKGHKKLSHTDRLYAMEEEKIRKSMEKTKPETKKNNKLMLTLNDIDQRLQKLQMKFFKEDHRPRYKCIKSPFFSGKPAKSVEVLYKNKSYPPEMAAQNHLKITPTPLLFQHKKEQLPTEICTQTSPAYSSRLTPRFEDKPTQHYEDIIRYTCNQDEQEIMDEILGRLASPKQSPDDEPEIIVIPKETKNFGNGTMDNLDDFDLNDEGSKDLNDLILKSNYLMQEFNSNKKPSYLNEDKLWLTKNIKSKGRKSNFANNFLGKLEGEKHEYKRDISKNYDNTNFEFALKDSLFCLDDQ